MAAAEAFLGRHDEELPLDVEAEVLTRVREEEVAWAEHTDVVPAELDGEIKFYLRTLDLERFDFTMTYYVPSEIEKLPRLMRRRPTLYWLGVVAHNEYEYTKSLVTSYRALGLPQNIEATTTPETSELQGLLPLEPKDHWRPVPPDDGK